MRSFGSSVTMAKRSPKGFTVIAADTAPFSNEKCNISIFAQNGKLGGRTWHNLNCPHPWPLTVGHWVHPLSLDLATSGHHRAPPPLSAGIVLQVLLVLHVPNRVYCYCYYTKVFRLQLPAERKCFVLYVGCTSTALLRDRIGFGDLGPGTHWKIVKPRARAIQGLMMRPERRIFDEVLLVRYTVK